MNTLEHTLRVGEQLALAVRTTHFRRLTLLALDTVEPLLNWYADPGHTGFRESRNYTHALDDLGFVRINAKKSFGERIVRTFARKNAHIYTLSLCSNNALRLLPTDPSDQEDVYFSIRENDHHAQYRYIVDVRRFFWEFRRQGPDSSSGGHGVRLFFGRKGSFDAKLYASERMINGVHGGKRDLPESSHDLGEQIKDDVLSQIEEFEGLDLKQVNKSFPYEEKIRRVRSK